MLPQNILSCKYKVAYVPERERKAVKPKTTNYSVMSFHGPLTFLFMV